LPKGHHGTEWSWSRAHRGEPGSFCRSCNVRIDNKPSAECAEPRHLQYYQRCRRKMRVYMRRRTKVARPYGSYAVSLKSGERMNDRLAHDMLVRVQRYFYRTSRSRMCACGCGKRISLRNYWLHPTVYKKVPEFLPGHSSRHPQTREHVIRRALAIVRTWEQKRASPSHQPG
jgi:hypothetical protein